MNMLLNYMKLMVAFTVLVALSFFSATAIGSSMQESVENEFELKYQQARLELKKFELESKRNQRLFPDSDVVRDGETLKELQDNCGQLLEKLVSLDPENEEYRFELAKLTATKGDMPKALVILNQLAPENAPGYPPAHFLLAKQCIGRPAASWREQQSNLAVALKHLGYVLSEVGTHPEAKLLKAQTLARVQEYDQSYRVYEELFEVDPKHYREMVALNKKLSREVRNPPVFEKALAGFLASANKKENQSDDKRWVEIEAGLAKLYQKLGRFDEAETRLNELLSEYSADPNGGPRRLFLQRLLAGTYVAWSDQVAGSSKVSYQSLPDEKLVEMIELNSKAFRSEPGNILAMQNLARLSLLSNNEIAAQARAIYDPTNDIDAPASVLNQLGNHMLLKKKFSEAIRYYEQAREKSPREPAILNNLAFGYLVASDDERNEARALQLVNEAIRFLPTDISEFEKAKFLHTKATALKQMGQLQEAVAVYEASLKSRPKHANTLRSLIECYEGLNMTPPKQYIERLK